LTSSDLDISTNYHIKCNYSIWILPDEKLQEYLSNIIWEISLKYGSPIFYPHITLLGGFTGNESNLIKNTICLSDRINSLKIIFDGIGYNNDYFFSFYLKVLLSKELKNMYSEAENIFQCTHDNYAPHLSLAYGLFEKKEKEEMLDFIEELPVSFIANNLCLAKNNEQALEWDIIYSSKF